MSCEFPYKAEVVLLAAVLLWLPQRTAGAGAENFISHVDETIAQTRSKLADLVTSAEHASKEFVAGGNLWVAGRQPDFIAEACGRAGGLMAIAPLGQRAPTNHDVILYAVPGSLRPEDLQSVEGWQKQGATVIRFNSAAGLYRGHFPVDTVANVVELWTWTGEFVAACTRLGKTPVLYQSYGLPGGPERGRKYQGKKFHDDLVIEPVHAQVLGLAYLDRIERMLAKLEQAQIPKIREAAAWWSEASSAKILVTGHMFPQHAQDPRAPKFGATSFAAVAAWEDKDLLEPDHPSGFVLYLGYQFAPRKLLDQAKATGLKLVYSDVEPSQPAEPASNILYIDPGWPLADGCVTLPGYDVPILPSSGVVQAAIYWSVASEKSGLKR